jgi:hypothetical protein
VTSVEARQLYGRLELARLELDSLRRLQGNAGGAIEPDWLQKLGFAPFPEADA